LLGEIIHALPCPKLKMRAVAPAAGTSRLQVF
jgi:hypothetical protein